MKQNTRVRCSPCRMASCVVGHSCNKVAHGDVGSAGSAKQVTFKPSMREAVPKVAVGQGGGEGVEEQNKTKKQTLWR